MSSKVMNDDLPVRVVHNLCYKMHGTSNLNIISLQDLGDIFDAMKLTREENQSKNKWERRAGALLQQWKNNTRNRQ